MKYGRRTFGVLMVTALGACGGSQSPSGTPAPAAPTGGAASPMSSEVEASAASLPTLETGAYTAEQAERGSMVFTETCSECHDRVEMHGDDFLFEWGGSSVGRLYRYLSRTMPDDAPGTLGEEAYVGVTAYILSLNDYPAGPAPLTTDEALLNSLMIGG